jgi:hypothetical protein
MGVKGSKRISYKYRPSFSGGIAGFSGGAGGYSLLKPCGPFTIQATEHDNWNKIM